VRPLDFRGAFALGHDPAVLALAALAQFVEVPFEFAPTPRVLFPVDLLFELLLAVALLDERDVDRRAGVIAESPEPAAVQLELDQVSFRLHEGDRNGLAGPDGNAVAVQILDVVLQVDRRCGCDVDVDAVRGAWHVELDRHSPALEERLQVRLALSTRELGEDQAENGCIETRPNHPAP